MQDPSLIKIGKEVSEKKDNYFELVAFLGAIFDFENIRTKETQFPARFCLCGAVESDGKTFLSR